jgi:hypothetical protein
MPSCEQHPPASTSAIRSFAEMTAGFGVFFVVEVSRDYSKRFVTGAYQ